MVAGGAGYKVLALLDVPGKSQEEANLYIHGTYTKKWGTGTDWQHRFKSPWEASQEISCAPSQALRGRASGQRQSEPPSSGQKTPRSRESRT